jgi:rhodanese-related sulfurtransferase
MANFNAISSEKLARLVGTPKAPVIIDVRTPEDFAESPFLLPASLKRDHADVAGWAASFRGRWVVVLCQKGRKLSEGVAAFLRLAGAEAEILEGGFEGWRDLGLPLLPVEKLPPHNTDGATLWVTRARPKIDRIACPWLIRRFVDPGAVFLFVAASEVEAVAERFGATPFDVEGVFWSHRGELCSFDVMIEEFALSLPALNKMAGIVRGADTDRLDIEPQAAGLLAISLGLSRMYSSDLEQLDRGMLIYDALYRWARDATDEKHDWVPRGGRA